MYYLSGGGADFFNRFFGMEKLKKLEQMWLASFEKRPTDDPLILATLLPIVEIREMVLDDLEVDTKFKKEDVELHRVLF